MRRLQKQFFIILMDNQDYKKYFFVRFFIKYKNIYKQVIKYNEFIIIIKYENILLIINDVDTLKYNYRIGLDTLLVYTIKYEY